MKNFIKYLTISAITLLLVGCGGGGGSEQSTPIISNATFPLRTAWVNYLNLRGTRTFTLQINEGGKVSNGSGTASFSPLQSATFIAEPSLASTTSITGQYTLDGKVIPYANTSTMHVDSNYFPLGRIDEQQGVVLNLAARSIPSTARVGDTGTMFTMTRYTDYTRPTQFNPNPFSNSLTIRGTSTFTFTVEPDTATSAILKIITQNRDTRAIDVGTEITKLRMNTDGAVVYISETFTLGADSVVATFN
jgi:hypothetical protein